MSEGADLLFDDYKIEAPSIAALLRDIPGESERAITEARERVISYLLRELHRRRSGKGENHLWDVARARAFVERLISQDPQERVKFASDALALLDLETPQTRVKSCLTWVQGLFR